MLDLTQKKLQLHILYNDLENYFQNYFDSLNIKDIQKTEDLFPIYTVFISLSGIDSLVYVGTKEDKLIFYMMNNPKNTDYLNISFITILHNKVVFENEKLSLYNGGDACPFVHYDYYKVVEARQYQELNKILTLKKFLITYCY